MSGFAAIGLNNPKIEANLGGVLRAAHCYSAPMVALRGHRYKRQYTDTTKAYRHIPLIHTNDSILDLCPFDCIPVAIESIDGSIPLPKFTHPKSAFYIFGAEDQTLGREILDRCKNVVMVPTAYWMNLAATVNVVLYDRMAKGKEYV
jgi:tRNA(Leu) C34 or U34 (ribose-2'-O)-methylase TrmL